MLPRGDELDREVVSVAAPSIANLAVVPIVGAVDTFWIGRMGSALALAGQGAANQVFFSAYFLIAFIPTITAPLVARAAGSGDIDGACTRVCEALFLANVLGLIGTLVLVLRPSWALGLVLPAGAPAAEAATRYLRLRSISLVPALVSSIGFAAFRGLLASTGIGLFATMITLAVSAMTLFQSLVRDKGDDDGAANATSLALIDAPFEVRAAVGGGGLAVIVALVCFGCWLVQRFCEGAKQLSAAAGEEVATAEIAPAHV